MEEKKIIKKYICPGRWVSVACIVLTVVLAATLVMGLAALNADPGEALKFYPEESPKGTMAYIDVVGVSDWLFQTDGMTYYSVEDAEGYLYTVRLTDTQFAAMAEQQKYWERTDDNAAVPEAYRLEGYVQDMSSMVRQNLSEVWGITEEEYDLYFGTRYLNATTSVGAENSALWFMGSLFSGIFALACLVFIIRAAANAKKCLNRLEERNLLEKAARQLEFTDNHREVGKNRGILTQDFLFGKGTGVVAAYDDILWAYQFDRKRNFMVACSYLMLGTRFMNPAQAIDLNRADKLGLIGDALGVISERNPNALIGFSGENRKAYRALVKNQ